MANLKIGYTLEELKGKLAEARAERQRLIERGEPVSRWLDNLILDIERRLDGCEDETEENDGN
jgi:hypothetical protein